jgi:protocatechuate 3,4-dioxygenase beta subunit/polyisoprenoid-binding protein YceI
MNTHTRYHLLTLLTSSLLVIVLGACNSKSTATLPPATSTPASVAPTTSPPVIMILPTPSEEVNLPTSNKTGCPITQAPAVAKSAMLTLGPSAGITPTTAQGEKLIILGTVYDSNCTPLSGASLNMWQTDANGEYGPGHGSDNLECCYLQGRVTTDDNGHYQLITVKPGYYKDAVPPVPPAHIHVEVRHPQAGTLQTEIVFADDPNVDPENAGYVVISLATAAGPEGAYLFLRGVADLVLPKATSSESAPARTDQARMFDIMPGQSEAAYQIREKFAIFAVTTTAVGVTPLLGGRLQIKLNDPPTMQMLTMTVDLRGLKSDEPSRDDKLPDHWLVTDDYPFAYFTATEIQNGPEHYTEGEVVAFTLIGDLTIRDVTRPTTFAVTAKISGSTLTGSATSTVKMTDFGIDPPNMLNFVVVEDEVLVTVNFTANETGAIP